MVLGSKGGGLKINMDQLVQRACPIRAVLGVLSNK